MFSVYTKIFTKNKRHKKTHSKTEWENCYEKEKVSRTSPRHYKFSLLFFILPNKKCFFYENISFTFSKNDLSDFCGFGLKLSSPIISSKNFR